MIFLYAMLDNIGGIKKYIVLLAVCMILFYMGRKRKWSVNTLFAVALPVMVYVLLGSFSALIVTNAQVTTVKVIIYVLVPLIFAFSLYTFFGKDMSKIVDYQFWGSFLAYKIFDAPVIFSLTTWESVYAFAFGIFAIYYAYKKRWKMFAAAMIFVCLGEKRIAILAAIASIIFFGVLRLFEYNKKLLMGFWGIIIGSVYLYIYAIFSGVMDAFCWGANINTNGRVEIYSRMANEFEFSIGFPGAGLGIVEKLLEYWNVAMYGNLHNDLLKFYIELGFCGLLIYLVSIGLAFWFIGKKFGKHQMCFFFVMFVYSIILFATDNVSIYMIYLIPMYSVFFACLSSNEQLEESGF